MTNLKKVSVEELRAELERREQISLSAPRAMSVPEFDLLALQKLRETCVSYLADVADKHPEPDTHYIFERALEVIFGEGIWEFISAKLE